MSAMVVDTDVISYLMKGDTRVEQLRSHLEGHILVVSFMSVAELQRWALARNWGSRRVEHMDAYLQRFVLHPFRQDLCLAWAQLTERAAEVGHRIQCADAWIAATARIHEIPLVTHNVKDYAGVRDMVQVLG